MKKAQQMRTIFPIGLKEEIKVSTTSFRPGALLMTLKKQQNNKAFFFFFLMHYAFHVIVCLFFLSFLGCSEAITAPLYLQAAFRDDY